MSKQYVKISGDVAHPGIYPICANNMANSVIELATSGSGRIHSEIQQFSEIPLNNGDVLDVRLNSGKTVLTKASMSVSDRLLMKIPLDILTMTEDDFQKIPGIGVNMARRIIEYRQNNGGLLCVADLVKVEGIGDKKYIKLRKYFK